METLAKVFTLLDTSLDYILTGVIPLGNDYLKAEIADMQKDCSPAKMRLILDVIKPIIEFNDK